MLTWSDWTATGQMEVVEGPYCGERAPWWWGGHWPGSFISK